MKSAPSNASAEPTLSNYFASNLRTLRKAAGWSQAETAQRVQLNRGNIASYESGHAEPSICKTLRISKLFNVTPRDLVRRDLSDPQELVLARIAHSQDEEDKRDRIGAMRSQANELSDLIRSSRRLFDYKRSQEKPGSAEAEQYAAHYEQLFEVTEQLLENYRQLLAESGCQCD